MVGSDVETATDHPLCATGIRITNEPVRQLVSRMRYCFAYNILTLPLQ